ncbi:hypothetical protein [Longirhabdus pacifica]|uniref:hypothetical protein n=1 Tax=Longirhabdus pacifica TaxID=2305227 RepID=UPI001008BE21|nr:hypothetical protein [Longirhabdus pacifica]
MLSKKIAACWIVFSCLWITNVVHAYGESERPATWWILSIPSYSYLEADDAYLSYTPHIQTLMQQGAVGALNVRTPQRGVEDSYLSIGAGAKAIVASDYQAYMTDDVIQQHQAIHLWNQYLHSPSTPKPIVIPSMYAITQQQQTTTATPGLLGDVLQEGNVHPAVFGNRDRGSGVETWLRHAPFMLMNADGTVDGNVGKELEQADDSRPYNVKTNYDALIEQIKMNTRQNIKQVTLIELGGLNRLYSLRHLYEPEQFMTLKLTILKEIDEFVGEMMSQLEAEDTLLLFSPVVHKQALQEKVMLAPIVLYKQNEPSALLYSETTKRPGIVSILDIAPTILEDFELNNETFIGKPIQAERHTNGLQWLQTDLGKITQVHTLRPQLLYPLITYEVTVLVIVIIVLLRNRDMPFFTLKLLDILLFSMLWIPIVFLVLGYVAFIPAWLYVSLFFLCWFLFTLLSYVSFSMLQKIFVSSSLTMILIVLDGWFGAKAMKYSILGYDPIIGARFYGIGNEYMGVLIGTAILSTSFLMQKFSHVRGIWVTVVITYVAIIAYLLLPQWGTNAGGALSATIAFCYATIGFYRIKKKVILSTKKMVLWIGMAGLIGLTLLISTSVLFSLLQIESHIGRAVTRLLNGDWAYIYALIKRKLEMNWHLVGVSAWSKVFFVGLFVWCIFAFDRRRRMTYTAQMEPYRMHGFHTLTFASIVAFLLNDSGIVAAATIITYVVVPVLMIKLSEKIIKQHSEQE